MSEAPTLVDAGRREAAGATVARLYERHGRTLFGLCRMLLRDAHEAEDALQATFLSAHGALLRGGMPRDEAAWLSAIARNECRGRIRERMRRPTNAGDDALEGAPDPGPAPDERLADPEVRRALAQLPDTQREAVVLHDVFGLRAREVGKALGMSVPAVEALLFRGRRQLRLRLRPAHGALVVPLGVGEALAEAIPGFATPEAAAAVAGGAGALGAGVLAKLAGAPAAAKVAAGVAAVATAGSVAAVEVERRARPATPVAVGRAADAIPGAQDPAGGAATTASATAGSAGSRAEGGDERSRSGPGSADGRDDAAPVTGRVEGRSDGERSDDRRGGPDDEAATGADDRGPRVDDEPEPDDADRSGRGGADDDRALSDDAGREEDDVDDDSSGPGSGGLPDEPEEAEEPDEEAETLEDSSGPGGGEDAPDEPDELDEPDDASGPGGDD